MRNIKYIVLHCTAGSAQQKTSDIISYWKNKLGWNRYGYHYLINADGLVEHLTPIAQPTNGVKGFNEASIHVCYKGGWNGTDTRTPEQKREMKRVVKELKSRFPHAQVVGHRDLSPDLNGDGKITPNEWIKLCPCFDAKSESWS